MSDNIHQIYFDSILTNVKAENTKQLYQFISKHINNMIGMSGDDVLKKLMLQEQKENSSIGNGVAISHLRLERLTRPLVIFAKMDRAIDFKSYDSEPVDLLCLVLSPEFEEAQHLQRLAKVTRLFTNTAYCDDLRAATDADDIRMYVKEINNQKIAA